MDELHINYDKRSDEFLCLSSSNEFIEKFNENQNRLQSINQKAIKLHDEIKVWIDRSINGGGQFKMAKGNVEYAYPSEIPPEDRKNDESYKECYAIADMYIIGWKNCNDEMLECQEKCITLIKEMRGNMEIVYNQLNISNPPVDDYIKVIFNDINDKLEKYEKNINECHAIFEKTKLQLNRARMGRTPAYNKQPQKCKCGEPYIYLKWCIHCDRKQFQQKFNTSDNLEIDRFLYDSQQSITYPNGYVEWIPYEQFIDIKSVGSGGFAVVYGAKWANGLGTWDYALGKRVYHKKTPVALKVLNNSKHMRQDFFDEIKAYMKFSSSTVLRCYGLSKEPITGNCIIVFPLAHGGDLWNYLKQRASNLNWVNRLDILRHILFGLLEIHKKGMIHRDFHPGNILHYRRMITVSDLGFTQRPTANEVYQEVLGWINKFDNDPESEIVKQFENKSNPLKPLDKTYSLSTKCVSKIIDRLDIMGDYSKENVHSIVTKYKAPQLKVEKQEMSDDTNSEKKISSNSQSVQSIALLSNMNTNIKITISDDQISSNCQDKS
ncbi:21247_t:CDS:2, partial [Gigaspora margarita]